MPLRTCVSHAQYATVSASDNLSKKAPPNFKVKENCQAVIPRQENKNSDTNAIALNFFDANANARTQIPTHFLVDASNDFPSSFSDKISVGGKAP